jgi:hypothetical protein
MWIEKPRSAVLDRAALLCYNTEKQQEATSECATDPSFFENERPIRSGRLSLPKMRIALLLSTRHRPVFRVVPCLRQRSDFVFKDVI